MTLASPNPNPRSGAALREILTSPEDRFVIFDVGARFGAERYWDSLNGIVEFVGFDPDQAACDYENSRAGANQKFYPYAIGGADGERTLNMARFAPSSGFLPSRPQWIERFPISTTDVVRQVTVPTLKLDTFVARHPPGHIDFLKVDVEGAEYEVFDGAQRTFKDCKLLGIKTELWWDPMAKGAKGYAEIDLLLRENGFKFYDLKLHYYARTALPAGRLNVVYEGGKPWGLSMKADPYGQAATGDALYFRDPVGELREGKTTIEWDSKTLMRLAGLYDIFDYGDSALELLETFYDQIAADYDVDALMDSMVPVTDNVVLDYGTYLEHSNWIRHRANEHNFGTCTWTPKPSNYGKRRKALAGK